LRLRPLAKPHRGGSRSCRASAHRSRRARQQGRHRLDDDRHRLVILMTIPGLALFYGGLVRAKNMLSVLMQVFVIFSLISVLWAVYGYSIGLHRRVGLLRWLRQAVPVRCHGGVAGRDLQQGRVFPN
jgi:uncharacterized protein with PQ loop repeat